jgi:GMP synthase (glutamine-hydrolysing)
MLDTLTPSTAGEDRAIGQIPALEGSDRGKKPVLIVLHQENSNPGHVGQWFVRHGYHLDIRKPRFGEALPATLAEHSGVVIFGGPMSANDKDAFVRTEIDWLKVPLAEKTPFLGICLGAQMLAVHLGAKVGFDPQDRAEIGYYPLASTEAGRALAFPDHVYQWHREGLELPRGAQLLATSDGAFPNQAFSYGASAFGVQFHPEITFAQMHRWSGHNNMRLEINGARERQQHIDGHVMHGAKVRAWLDDFLSRWVTREFLAQSANVIAT